MTLTAQQPG